MNYPLHKMNKKGTLLSASTSFYSDEYAEQILSLYLSDQIIEGDDGHMKKRYRLHAKQPHSIEMALAYDIDCPHCKNRLKQVGRCLNYHELGLYACPACDKR